MSHVCRSTSAPTSASIQRNETHSTNWNWRVITSFASINRFYFAPKKECDFVEFAVKRGERRLKGKTNIKQLVKKFAIRHCKNTDESPRCPVEETRITSNSKMCIACTFFFNWSQRKTLSPASFGWILSIDITELPHANSLESLINACGRWRKVVIAAFVALLYVCLHRKHFTRL